MPKKTKTTTDTKTTLVEYHLSDQALGALMMALQKSLLEQSDITPVLKGFRFASDENKNLVVLNPPLVKVSHEDAALLEETRGTAERKNEASPKKGDKTPNQMF